MNRLTLGLIGAGFASALLWIFLVDTENKPTVVEDLQTDTSNNSHLPKSDAPLAQHTLPSATRDTTPSPIDEQEPSDAELTRKDLPASWVGPSLEDLFRDQTVLELLKDPAFALDAEKSEFDIPSREQLMEIAKERETYRKAWKDLEHEATKLENDIAVRLFERGRTVDPVEKVGVRAYSVNTAGRTLDGFAYSGIVWITEDEHPEYFAVADSRDALPEDFGVSVLRILGRKGK